MDLRLNDHWTARAGMGPRQGAAARPFLAGAGPALPGADAAPRDGCEAGSAATHSQTMVWPPGLGVPLPPHQYASGGRRAGERVEHVRPRASIAPGRNASREHPIRAGTTGVAPSRSFCVLPSTCRPTAARVWRCHHAFVSTSSA